MCTITLYYIIISSKKRLDFQSFSMLIYTLHTYTMTFLNSSTALTRRRITHITKRKREHNKNEIYSVVCVSVIINIAGVLIVPVYVRGGGLRGRDTEKLINLKNNVFSVLFSLWRPRYKKIKIFVVTFLFLYLVSFRHGSYFFCTWNSVFVAL